MAETSLTFDVLARDRASQTFAKIGRSTSSLERSMGRLSRTARVALGGFAAFEAGRAVRAIASIGIAYQDSLNIFQSVTRATGTQMDEVANKAKQLGANLKLPTTSAADAAAAMTELAKGGLNVNQSMKAALGTLQLATAAQVDGAQAAQIQSAALAQFGLNGKAAGHVADLLAGAANAAQGEMTDMATALTYVGPVAHAAGISIDATALAITALAKQGILGQKAGTGLRGVLTSLTKPSKQGAVALKALGVEAFDAQGNFVGFQKVAEQLAAAQRKFTRQGFGNAVAAAFGRQQLASVNALAATGTTTWTNYAKALGNKNNVERVSAARSKGLGGALRGLQSQFETLGISLYQKVAPQVEHVVRQFSRNLPRYIDEAKAAFQRFAPTLRDLAHNAADLARALKPTAVQLAKMTAGAVLGGLKALSGVMKILADHSTLLRAVIDILIARMIVLKTQTRLAAGEMGAMRLAAVRMAGPLAALAVAADTAYSTVRNENAKAAESFRQLALKGGSDLYQLEGKWAQLTAAAKEQSGLQKAATQALADAMKRGLEAAGVSLDSIGAKFVDVANKAAVAANAVANFFTTALGGDHTPRLPNYKLDPGHPGGAPKSGGKTAGGGGKTGGSGPGTVGFDIGKAMGDGVAKGLSASASKAITAAKAMVDKINQQFKDLKTKARDLARSIADTMRASADLSNLSQTDSLGAAMAPTVASIKSFLDDQLKNDRQFRRTLRALHANGLSDALYRQFAQGGPAQYGAIVQALGGASSADLRDISRTNRAIGDMGMKLGTNVAVDRYGAAIKEAKHDARRANQLLENILHKLHNDSLSNKDIHKLAHAFRQAIHHLEIRTDTAVQDRKQGNRVKAG